LIAVLLGVIVCFAGGSLLPSLSFEGMSQLPVVMLWINLALFLFNLIPAFPMDGGRMLRSVLAKRMSYLRATLIAARLGQLSALSFSIFVLWENQYPLILVGVFVFVSAQFELNQARLKQVNEVDGDSIGA
jgi:Zn-dependent protease